VERSKLEQHLREARFNERKFIGYLKDKLADAGPPERVRVDKQQLAREKKKERPPMSCRSPNRNAVTAAIAKAKRLAALDADLRAKGFVKPKYSGKYREFGHFVEVISPLEQGEADRIMQTAQDRCIQLLTYLFLFRSAA
jgi:hypothetical protein